MEKPQSATFTVSADSPQELARLLRRIADALDGGSEAGTPATPSPEPPHWTDVAARSASPLYRWNLALVGDLWSRIDTPGARHALEFLSRQSGPVSVDELGRELGKEPGPALAGTLSPIGRAVAAMEAPPPYRRVRSHYVVDDEFARLFRALVREEPNAEAPPAE